MEEVDYQYAERVANFLERLAFLWNRSDHKNLAETLRQGSSMIWAFIGEGRRMRSEIEASRQQAERAAAEREALLTEICRLRCANSRDDSTGSRKIPAALAPFRGCIAELNNQVLHAEHAIYFLVEDDEVIYAGESSCPLYRIGIHAGRRRFRFDRAFYMPVDPAEAVATERAFIRFLRPRLNKVHRKGVLLHDHRLVVARYSDLPASLEITDGTPE